MVQRVRTPRIVLLFSALCACAGPEAPDSAVCADVIERLCAQPVCAAVTRELDLTGSCEPTLFANTGCGSEDFAFTTPTRERFLACRLPLLRAGAERGQPPACDDVDEAFGQCPDVVTFLNGGAP